MDQGDESPLFCREDTPPRSGVPPGYVSIRPLLLQRQQSSASHQTQRNTKSVDEVLQGVNETAVSFEEDNVMSSALVNPTNDTANTDLGAHDSYSTENTSLPLFFDRAVVQNFEENGDAFLEEGQVADDDSFSGYLAPPVEEHKQTSETTQPQRAVLGDESPLFCREGTPPRSGVPPGYQSLRAVMARGAHRSRSPVAQSLPPIPEEPHRSDSRQRHWTRPYTATQHSSTALLAPSQTTPLRPQLLPRPMSISQPTPTVSVAQQRPILPYVFQPSSVPQTPMESTLAAPIITKGEARSGTAVYPKYPPVTTSTAEGLYTLTNAQVYWDSRGRPQCFKIGCDNNQGIGYSSEVSRDEHITNRRYHSQVPHLGYEQTKRGYQNGRDYPLL